MAKSDKRSWQRRSVSVFPVKGKQARAWWDLQQTRSLFRQWQGQSNHPFLLAPDLSSMFVQNLMTQCKTSFRLALLKVKVPYLCFKHPVSFWGTSWQIASDAKRDFRFPTHVIWKRLQMDLCRHRSGIDGDDIAEEMFEKHPQPKRITHHKKRLSRHARL